MADKKMVVNLEQQDYYNSTSGQHKDVPVEPGDEHVYKVKSLKNCLYPKIGSFISAGQAVTLVEAGYEVNVSAPAK